MDNFVRASKGFGLTVSIAKTEVLHQSPAGGAPEELNITVDEEPLKVANSFTYLGSTITNDAQLDGEIDCRIAMASSSFRRLQSRVWGSHDLKLKVKLSVYRAVVLSTLLYSAETWTLYNRHIRKLESFHQRCLRTIMCISWESRTTNVEVLAKAE